ncbi:hypothetical protein CU039_0101 [Enterococcus faecium]|nr:hypothetical protein [Enterococcus faecium]
MLLFFVQANLVFLLFISEYSKINKTGRYPPPVLFILIVVYLVLAVAKLC